MDKNLVRARIKKEIIEWVFCFIVAYVIYLFLNYFIGTISGVKQISMKPTANEGEKLIIQRMVFVKKDIVAGDIITFLAPLDTTKSMDFQNTVLKDEEATAKYKEHSPLEGFLFNFVGIGKKSYIKRVIGVAGDHIIINENGAVLKNGEVIAEPYLKDGITSRNGPFTNIIVPENTVFAMGDNRLQSLDSRSFGCVPLSKIDGYVKLRVWPFDKIGNIE